MTTNTSCRFNLWGFTNLLNCLHSSSYLRSVRKSIISNSNVHQRSFDKSLSIKVTLHQKDNFILKPRIFGYRSFGSEGANTPKLSWGVRKISPSSSRGGAFICLKVPHFYPRYLVWSNFNFVCGGSIPLSIIQSSLLFLSH